MFEKTKKAAAKFADAASSAAASAATLVGDLNGDGKVDEADAKIAIDWTRKVAADVGDEAAKLAKGALKSDMMKDAATGAAIGAAVAIPVPFVGPMAGAAVGAGIGVYRNLTKAPADVAAAAEPAAVTDRYAELVKLEELRAKGILTDSEFAERKRRVLGEL